MIQVHHFRESHAMLTLAQLLLRSAGLVYDDIEETWIAPLPLQPVAEVECDENRAYIREALREAQRVLDTRGMMYCSFVVNGRVESQLGST
jgi:hypothetical protein